VWKVTAPDGRIAWYCGDAPEQAPEMAAELFPGTEVTVEEVDAP